MNNKKFYVWMAAEALVFMVILALVITGKNAATPSGGQSAATATGPTEQATIVYGDKGFSPANIEVSENTRVVFQNNSTKDFWPASNNHPSHTLYPGSGISECGKVTDGSNFDACGPVKPGVLWSFVFKEKGTWGYHDHLNPSQAGTIVVK